MAALDWFRALQLPVLPVSIGAAVVGTLLGVRSGGAFDPVVFALVASSLAVIQLASNLQKGLVESADLDREPRRPTSDFVFDAGAVLRLPLSRAALTRLTLALFVAGCLLGLVVVAIRRDPVLLVLGAAGAAAAYTYSGPPLKLSYHGLGEVSTFIAFGPLMVTGAAYAQHPQIAPASLVIGVAMGFFAAAVSFARYFPAEEEDRDKGKRTPVVRLGYQRGVLALLLILVAGASTLAAGGFLFGDFLGMSFKQALAVTFSTTVLWGGGVFVLRQSTSDLKDLGTALVVGCHYVVCILFSVGLLTAIRAG